MAKLFDSFDVIRVLEAGSELRAVAEGATSSEGVARVVVDFLRSAFVNKTNDKPAFELVRFYKLIRCGDLPAPLQDVARAASTDSRSLHDSPCLTLLASAGSRPEWNDRHRSSRHRAMPLDSGDAVAQMPMVAGLLDSLGVDVAHLAEGAPAAFNPSTSVFFVPHALDSALIPAQGDFVLPFGIESVVGFGGRLPDASAFAVVAFSSVPIEQSSVAAFEAMGLSATLAMIPVLNGADFADDPQPVRQRTPAVDSGAARLSVLDLLVHAIESALADHTTNLEHAWLPARDEAEIMSSDHRLAARQEVLVEHALDCVVDMDSAGRITGFNPAAVDVFGHERDAVLGRRLADVMIPPEERERHRLGLDAYLATGEGRIIGRRMEVEAVRADGSRFPIELSVAAFDEDPPTFTGRIRDLSEQKFADQALLASRDNLAHVARTLQQSLLPARLPSIPGADLAAIYRPGPTHSTTPSPASPTTESIPPWPRSRRPSSHSAASSATTSPSSRAESTTSLPRKSAAIAVVRSPGALAFACLESRACQWRWSLRDVIRTGVWARRGTMQGNVPSTGRGADVDATSLRTRNDRRCRHILDRAAPLVTDDLDWDSVPGHEVDPEVLDCLVYMRDVEGFTDRDLVGLTAHRTTLADPLIRRFLHIWRGEEAGHARELERFLSRYAERGVAIPPRQLPPPSVAPVAERIVSRVGGPVGAVVTAAHMAWGAANELLTLNGYRLLADRCRHPMLTALLTRISAQEARHFSFYLLQAEWRLAASRSARQVLPRILERSWTPVGIGDGYKTRGEFDRVLAFLGRGNDGRRVIERMDARFSALPGFNDLNIFRAATAAGSPQTNSTGS